MPAQRGKRGSEQEMMSMVKAAIGKNLRQEGCDALPSAEVRKNARPAEQANGRPFIQIRPGQCVTGAERDEASEAALDRVTWLLAQMVLDSLNKDEDT